MKIALTAAALLLASTASAKTVVVTADRMVDVLSGKMVEQPVVVITDGRIASVVSAGTQRPFIPEGAERIDLPGKTILPGLIDMHVHLGGTPLVQGYRALEYTDSFNTVMAVPNAEATLKAGFTTVRSLGDYDYADVALQQAIDDGFLPGPRIVPATYALGATGGHCDENTNRPSDAKTSPGVADGPEAVRAKVRELRKLGARVLKVCATGGVFSRNTDPGAQQMTYEELKMAADEAHMLGMKSAAHAHGADGIKAAIRAGIDTIEHVSFIDDEGIRLAKEKGTWLGFDVYNTEYTLSEGEANGVLPENLEKERRVGTIQRENFAKAAKAEAKMIFSTDGGIYPHGLNARQFAVMVRFGLSPIQAIRTATSNAAQALGWEKDVGAIAVGRYGDIIAIEGDPLADVSLLEKVDVVIKGGERVNQDR
ncbi:metal-dependent hydrolase family protein [Allosphingosinicella vermicomposti]|uniref:Xaa-Pro dipeptidase n=1 Tax=Allosphingosinicella vermicomposti TaxID=614671 RepID=UPI000D10226B|nr:amidohydrolase family protein [Allosphingosinicella vermicomposti]